MRLLVIRSLACIVIFTASVAVAQDSAAQDRPKQPKTLPTAKQLLPKVEQILPGWRYPWTLPDVKRTEAQWRKENPPPLGQAAKMAEQIRQIPDEEWETMRQQFAAMLRITAGAGVGSGAPGGSQGVQKIVEAIEGGKSREAVLELIAKADSDVEDGWNISYAHTLPREGDELFPDGSFVTVNVRIFKEGAGKTLRAQDPTTQGLTRAVRTMHAQYAMMMKQSIPRETKGDESNLALILLFAKPDDEDVKDMKLRLTGVPDIGVQVTANILEAGDSTHMIVIRHIHPDGVMAQIIGRVRVGRVVFDVEAVGIGAPSDVIEKTVVPKLLEDLAKRAAAYAVDGDE